MAPPLVAPAWALGHYLRCSFLKDCIFSQSCQAKRDRFHSDSGRPPSWAKLVRVLRCSHCCAAREKVTLTNATWIVASKYPKNTCDDWITQEAALRDDDPEVHEEACVSTVSDTSSVVREPRVRRFGPKISRFFFLSRPPFSLFFSLTVCLLVVFWLCFGRSEPQMCLFSPSSCLVPGACGQGPRRRALKVSLCSRRFLTFSEVNGVLSIVTLFLDIFEGQKRQGWVQS